MKLAPVRCERNDHGGWGYTHTPVKLAAKGENVQVSEFCEVVRCNDTLNLCEVRYEDFRRSTTSQLLTSCLGRVLNVRLLQSECDTEKKEQSLAVSELQFCRVLLLVWICHLLPDSSAIRGFSFRVHIAFHQAISQDTCHDALEKSIC